MKDIKLTKRMKSVADMVTKKNRVADIGCDHAYVSIYLIKEQITDKVIAMDVRKGPLDIALRNVKKYNLDSKIDIRLSDGLEKLSKDEVDSIIIAGMGGLLICDILKKKKEILYTTKELILQPQSEIENVRRLLHELEYDIVDEDMLVDAGKYYNIIKATNKKIGNDNFFKHLLPEFSEKNIIDSECNKGGCCVYNKVIYYKYGKVLLDNKNMLLYEYLNKERVSCLDLLNTIKNSNSLTAMNRLKEIEKEISYIEEALLIYDM